MKLWSWGANTNGQLGHGFCSEQISRPTRVTTDIISQLLLLCRKAEENPRKLEHSDSDTRKETTLKIHGGGTQVLICSLKPQGENTSSVLLYLGNETPIHVKNNVQSPKSNSLMPCSTNPTVTVPQTQTFQPTLVSKDLCVKSLSCGWDFNLLITESSEVYSWGNNKYGQLGRQTDDSYESQIKLDPLPEFEAVQVSTGLRHAAAVGTDGCLYIWGDNTKSQLGLSSSERIIFKPTKLTVKTNQNNQAPQFVNVKCGKSFTIALDSDGRLWGCGSNKFGQLGINPYSVTQLTKLQWPSDPLLSQEMHIKDIVCGWNHVIVLLSNGKLVSWGRNNFNQLGRSVVSAKTAPVHPSRANVDSDFDPIPGYVEFIPEAIDSIACGSEHNLILGVSGTAYSWGWNEHENCGVKSSRISTSEGGMKIGEDCVILPTAVKFPDGAGKIIQVSCGAGNGFAISV